MTGVVEYDFPRTADSLPPYDGDSEGTLETSHSDGVPACREDAFPEEMRIGEAVLLLGMPEGSETSGADIAPHAAPNAAVKKPRRKRRKNRSLIDLAEAELKRNAGGDPQVCTSTASQSHSSIHNCGGTMASKFCPYCRSEVLQSFKFCMSCGKDVTAIWNL